MFELVCKQILALGLPGVRSEMLDVDTRLVEGLGLDSMRFLDLTVLLEDALQVDEFPMESWIDAELNAGKPLTLGGLSLACTRIVEGAHPGSPSRV